MDNFAQFTGPVLCVAAHPEDIEIHAGGTVARLVQAGIEVNYVLCTSGNRGTADPAAIMAEVGAQREKEQRQAAATLDVDDISFLGHGDGDLRFIIRDLRTEIVRFIRQKRPRTVITHDPFPGDGSHDSCAIYPDHLTVGMVTFEAAFVCAPGPLFYPEQVREGLSPHKPEQLYFVMSQHPDTFVDVGQVWGQKMEAVRLYKSQGRHRPDVEPFFRHIAGELGAKVGVEVAEGFRRLVPS